MKFLWQRSLAVVVALALAACASPGGADPSGTAREGADATRRLPSAIPSAEPSASEEDAMVGDLPDELLAGVMADASERTGLSRAEIEVVEAREVTWNDGSLGCPKPGQMYTQALVDGFQVIVDAGGERLDYRADRRGRFRICESPIRGGSGND